MGMYANCVLRNSTQVDIQHANLKILELLAVLYLEYLRMTCRTFESDYKG